MHDLIKEVIACHFTNPYLAPLADAAVVDVGTNKLIFTTDSYVIKPLFFPGGDIGKLAVCGTVNDLTVSGARPRYLSCSFIIEEGLEIALLKKICASLAETAAAAEIQVVTGDTKVVEKGAADGIFINTAGVGEPLPGVTIGYDKIEPGDAIIVTGTIGDHGMAVMAARDGLKLTTTLSSDCAPLNGLLTTIQKDTRLASALKFMRDPTRGGLATTLCEVAEATGLTLEIDETRLPVREDVKGLAEILGIDPLYSANEGKMVMIVASQHAEAIRTRLAAHPLGKNAAIIGQVKDKHDGRVILKTEIGTHRQIGMLSGAQLPRIC